MRDIASEINRLELANLVLYILIHVHFPFLLTTYYETRVTLLLFCSQSFQYLYQNVCFLTVVLFIRNLIFLRFFLQADEQMENETDEQFEERVLNKRAFQVFTTVRTRLQLSEQTFFTDMCHRHTRKQVGIL